MKGSEVFKETIKAHLEKKAGEDPAFMLSYLKENKNIDDCISYILNKVQESQYNGYADEEIFSMAIHYYDEDNIEIGKSNVNRVVVNHHVELTTDEKEELKEQAIREVIAEEKSKVKAKHTKPTETKKQEAIQISMFD